ncbi:MAG TPA: hypothetical protein VGM84_09195 [Steroidobacteraceae bacterium]
MTVLVAVSIPVWYARSASDAKYGVDIAVGAVIIVPAVLAAAAVLIWISGLGVWMQSRRLSRERPDSVFFFSQKSSELESVVAGIGPTDDRSGFYYLLSVGRENLELYLGGRLLTSVSLARVKDCRASSTSVRGLELPCVMIVIDQNGVDVDLPIQAARTPWAALFPTSPSGAARFSLELGRLLGLTKAE